MTTDQKVASIAKVLKRITQEKIDLEKAKSENLNKHLKNLDSETGFLVNEQAVKEKKKTYAKYSKDQDKLIKDLEADLKALDKCMSE